MKAFVHLSNIASPKVCLLTLTASLPVIVMLPNSRRFKMDQNLYIISYTRVVSLEEVRTYGELYRHTLVEYNSVLQPNLNCTLYIIVVSP